jgi:hypothetical protein
MRIQGDYQGDYGDTRIIHHFVRHPTPKLGKSEIITRDCKCHRSPVFPLQSQDYEDYEDYGDTCIIHHFVRHPLRSLVAKSEIITRDCKCHRIPVRIPVFPYSPALQSQNDPTRARHGDGSRSSRWSVGKVDNPKIALGVFGQALVAADHDDDVHGHVHASLSSAEMW